MPHIFVYLTKCILLCCMWIYISICTSLYQENLFKRIIYIYICHLILILKELYNFSININFCEFFSFLLNHIMYKFIMVSFNKCFKSRVWKFHK